MTAPRTYIRYIHTHTYTYTCVVKRKKFPPAKSGRVAVRVNFCQRAGKSFDDETRLFRARVRIIRVRDVAGTRLFTPQRNGIFMCLASTVGSAITKSVWYHRLPDAKPSRLARNLQRGHGEFPLWLTRGFYFTYRSCNLCLRSFLYLVGPTRCDATFQILFLSTIKRKRDREKKRKKKRAGKRGARERLTEIFRRIPGRIRSFRENSSPRIVYFVETWEPRWRKRLYVARLRLDRAGMP